MVSNVGMSSPVKNRTEPCGGLLLLFRKKPPINPIPIALPSDCRYILEVLLPKTFVMLLVIKPNTMNADVSFGASPVSSLPYASTPVRSLVARKSGNQIPGGFSRVVELSSFVIANSSPLTAKSSCMVRAKPIESIQATCGSYCW
jgi:hypothetical protein